MRWTLALVALLGCGTTEAIKPEPPAPSAGTSGARIKARVQKTADGASRFIGWRDTELGVDCAPALAADGKTRCLPEASGAAFFGDAACSKPLVRVDTGCAPLKYARASAVATCGSSPTRILTVGAKRASGPVHSSLSAGRCEQLPDSVSKDHEFYETDGEVDATKFAEVNETLE